MTSKRKGTGPEITWNKSAGGGAAAATGESGELTKSHTSQSSNSLKGLTSKLKEKTKSSNPSSKSSKLKVPTVEENKGNHHHHHQSNSTNSSSNSPSSKGDIPKNHSVGNIMSFIHHLHHRRDNSGDGSHMHTSSSVRSMKDEHNGRDSHSSNKDRLRRAGSFKDVWDAVSHFHIPSVRSRANMEEFHEDAKGRPHYKFQDLKVPLNFDSFTVNKQLGSGTFGKVYHCKHKETNETVVIKAIDKAFILKSGQMEHIKEEKEILKMLSQHDCPFTVCAVACFQDERNLYFVMEYLPGGELFAHLNGARNHRFSEKRAKFYIGELIIALKYMHEKERIVYRDIKPENMLLDKRGHLKVIDFGFAKHLHEEEKTYTFCGTPDYLAPEVIRGDGYNYEADLWSLGVFIYELVVGYAPFKTVNAATNKVDYRSILAGQFSLPAFLSATGKDIIMGLLQVDRRYRLGAKRGLIEVMDHPWFEGMDFELLAKKELKPPKLHRFKKGLVNIQKNQAPNQDSIDEKDQELFKQFDFDVSLEPKNNGSGDDTHSHTSSDDGEATMMQTCRDSKVGMSDMNTNTDASVIAKVKTRVSEGVNEPTQAHQVTLTFKHSKDDLSPQIIKEAASGDTVKSEEDDDEDGGIMF